MSSSAADKALPKHPTNKKPYPHSPAGSIITPAGDHVSLTYEPLDVQKATKEVSSRWAGAAVVFLGMTRDDRTQGSGEDSGTTLRVQRLEYEAYTPLALKTLHSIVHRARSTPTSAWPPADLTSADVSKMDSELESALSNMSLQGNSSTHTHTTGHTSAGTSVGGSSGGSIRRRKSKELESEPPSSDSIIRIALINRLGPVEVGEASILVAVSSPHRRRAFEVAEWLLEETKRKVPIWKREVRVKAAPVEHKTGKSKAVEVQEDGRGWVGLESAQQKDNLQNGQSMAAAVES